MRIMPGGALEQELASNSNTSCFVGSKLDEHRGAFLLDYPMEKGYVRDGQWDAMERVWEVSFIIILFFKIYSSYRTLFHSSHSVQIVYKYLLPI